MALNLYSFNDRNAKAQLRDSLQNVQVSTLEFTERQKFTERAFKINSFWGFSWEEEGIGVATFLRTLAVRQSNAGQPSLRSIKWMCKK